VPRQIRSADIVRGVATARHLTWSDQGRGVWPLIKYTRKYHGRCIQGITPDSQAILQQHDWLGNVRELHIVVERLTITCESGMI